MTSDSFAYSTRQATLQDAVAVAKLGASVFSTSFGHSVTPEQLRAYLDDAYSVEATRESISDPQKHMVVAVAADGTVIGFALLNRASNEPCVEHINDKIELQRIYVSTAHHGAGIGKRLLNEVQSIARKHGFNHMWLGVWEENHKAQHVYRKSGFQFVGSHDFDV